MDHGLDPEVHVMRRSRHDKRGVFNGEESNRECKPNCNLLETVNSCK